MDSALLEGECNCGLRPDDFSRGESSHDGKKLSRIGKPGGETNAFSRGSGERR